MLSFGSASMLWWGLAAVIPFVLHLWNRKPRQVVPFAATRFLVAATKRQSRRLKFQQWILLLARVAILLLLALALADPRWGASAATSLSGVATHHLLVIDDSYSMDAKIESERRIDLAKARLREIVQSAPPGDLFSLVAMGEPAEILIAGPSHDRAELELAINAVSIRQGKAKVAPALSLVRRLIEDGQALSTTPRAHRVTIASDMARNSWGDLSPEQIDAELASADVGCTWSLVVVGDVLPRNNLTIADLSCNTGAAYFGQPLAGEMAVANTGAREVENALLEIRAGDQTLFREEVSLGAGQQRSVAWRIDPRREISALTARVDSDDLEADNRRYLMVETRAAPRVLCLASSDEAARHFVMALTSGPVETRPKVDVVQLAASGDEKARARITEYDAVVLLNIALPTGEFAQALHSYVENGGGLLVGLGDRTGDHVSNRAGASEMAKASELYPATLGPLVKLIAPRIDPLNYEHPLLAAFRDTPEVGLLSAPIWRYQKLEHLHAQAKVAARFGNGDPALVEESFGRGKVVLFASSLGAESIDPSESPAAPWSGLAGSAAYVPLIREWVMHCATPAPGMTLSVGDPVATALGDDGIRGVEYSVDEDWRSLPSASAVFPSAGFFRARGKLPVAVNLDSKESWFSSDRERFAAWIDTRSLEAPQSTVTAPRTAQSLSVWVLIPLAFLVSGELLLATWMRHAKSPLAPRRLLP